LLQGVAPLLAGVGFHGFYNSGCELVGLQGFLRMVLRGQGVAECHLRLKGLRSQLDGCFSFDDRGVGVVLLEVVGGALDVGECAG